MADDGPARPSMATRSAIDGPVGPVVAGDHLRRDRQQATPPLRMGGLGIRQASDMSHAAFLGSCSASKEMVCQLLDLSFVSDFMLVGEEMAQKTFVTLFRSSCPFASTSQTTLQSVIDDQTYANVLSQYSILIRLAY